MEFLPDDAWYYFEIAERAASGQGLTFDGINVTNGFHPLWMLLLVMLARTGLPLESVALSIQIGLLLAGVGLSTRLTTRPLSVLIAWLLVLSSFDGLKCFINGMESTLAFSLVVGVMVLASRRNSDSRLLGVLAGLAVTSRWTNVLILVPTLGMLLHERPRRELLVLVFSASLPISSVLVWLWISTGHLIPVSAAIKTGATASPGLGALVGIGVVALAVWTWRLRFDASETRVRWGLATGVSAIVLGDVALRGVVVPEIWTLWPHVLLLVLVAATLDHWKALVLVVLQIVIDFVSWRHRLEPESTTAYEAATRSGEWLEGNSPPSSIAAGWDVGFIAGHTTRAVVNLDGLVNSWEYKERVLDRHRVGDYLEEELKPDFLVQDLPVAILRHDNLVSFKGARLGSWYVSRAECFVFSAATSPWQNQRKVALVLSKQARTQTDTTLAQQRLQLCAGTR